jgi:hypothetical protein
MAWWPRHTPRIGSRPAKWRDGRHRTRRPRPASTGPGETTRRSGRRSRDALRRVISSLRHDLHLLAQLAEVLHQVVGEAVVVVDHQQPGGRHPEALLDQLGRADAARAPWPRSPATPASGTESATMPAAACTYSVLVLDDAGADGDGQVHVAGEARGSRRRRRRCRACSASSSSMISIARILGAPVRVPAGKVARSTSKRVRPGLQHGPRRC